jgi:signal transduction histidine kinase
MPPEVVSQARAERVIALSRLIVAAASLLAVVLDPSAFGQYDAYVTRTLALGYLAAALGLLALLWRATVIRERWQFLIHVFDLAAASLFISLTAGTDSPFFLYLIFALMSAALRWETRGIAWTGAAVLTVFVGAYLTKVGTDTPPGLNSFVIRTTYLVVVALMLRHLSTYAAHVREITNKLRTWQPAVSNETGRVIRDALGYAADVLAAPRAAMVWEDTDEPEVWMVWWTRGEITVRRERPGVFYPLVAAPYEDADFLCRDPSAGRPAVVFTSRDRIETALVSMPPVHAEFIRRFGIRTLLAVRCGPGRLLVVDKPQPTADDLRLAQTVAHQVSSSLDQVALLQRLEDMSVFEARRRVARDLHDGILQSLTAITLRLQAMGRTLDEARRLRIEAIQTVIRDEAARLRRFIQELSLPASRPGEEYLALSGELDFLRHQLERDWRLRVELVGHNLVQVPSHIVRDVYFIVREALINVARHADASTARASLATDGKRLTITVADDGRGFPFRGRYEGAELVAMDRAPKVLYERVASRGGRLVVESSAGGSSLEIELPLSETSSA